MASRSKGEGMAASSTSASSLGNDFTGLFHDLVKSHDESQQKRQRWERQRDESLGPIQSQEWVTRAKGKEKSGQGVPQREKDCLKLKRADEEWIGEARKVHRSILAVVEFLQSIRRPYLLNEPGAGRRVRIEGGEEKGSLNAWKGVTNLTDKERDEIEFQVKVMIKRCLARIKELERGEELRKRTTPSLSANPFSRLMGSASTSAVLGRSHPLYGEQLSQHRSAITQYLSRELAQVNSKVGDLQEARLRTQQRQRLNMAGSAANQSSRGGSKFEKQTIVAGSVGGMSSKSGTKAAGHAANQDELSSSHTMQTDFSSSQLSPEQVQQFEQESSALIKSLSEDLSAVEAAEKKLSEVSELQTQLIQHLGSQAEVASHLNQEAIGHTLEVGRGNEQLQKAKENNRQASKFLCIFLVGSGLGLLFLHWMD